jgi:WD40 repeat protein
MAISGSDDHTLKFWHLDLDNKKATCIHTLKGHKDAVRAVAITPNGKIAISGSRDNNLKLWNLQNGEEIRTLEGHTGWVRAIAITSNGKKAGLQSLDKIISIDSVPVTFYDEMSSILGGKKNQSVTLQIDRKGTPINVVALVNSDGKIGMPPLSMDQYDSLGVFKLEQKKYGFFEAIPAGITMALGKLKFYIDQFKLILNPIFLMI